MKQKDLAVGLAYGLVAGMTFGLVAGVFAGVIFAPASGAETRRRLRYERDNALEAARFRLGRNMARRDLAQPGMEEEEEGGGFIGA